MLFFDIRTITKNVRYRTIVCDIARFWKKSPFRFFFRADIPLFYSCLQKIASRRDDAFFCAKSHTGCFSLSQIRKNGMEDCLCDVCFRFYFFIRRFSMLFFVVGKLRKRLEGLQAVFGASRRYF
jgi:hypothetical protein